MNRKTEGVGNRHECGACYVRELHKLHSAACRVGQGSRGPDHIELSSHGDSRCWRRPRRRCAPCSGKVRGIPMKSTALITLSLSLAACSSSMSPSQPSQPSQPATSADYEDTAQTIGSSMAT